MATILKWNEPRVLEKEASRGVSRWTRIRRRAQVPFIIGVVLGVFLVARDGGAPRDVPELLRALAVVTCLGLLFGVVYGAASFLPVRILVRHDHIGRQQGESYTRFEYKAFRDFRFEAVEHGAGTIELLTLVRNDGAIATFELAPVLDKAKLEDVLRRLIRERGPSA